MSEHVLTRTNPEPVVRVRISHTASIKDGWRMDSTTVEVSAPIPTPKAGAAYFPDLAALMDDAYTLGTAEAARRNREEGRH